MLDYIKAELLRFRAWAIAYAALHLTVLGFLTRVIDLAQQPLFFYQMFAGVYVLSGLLLGAYQMGNYRKPNTWLNLLHRPVAHRRLGLALMLAAALLLALAVLLPALLTAGWQEGMRMTGVIAADTRIASALRERKASEAARTCADSKASAV